MLRIRELRKEQHMSQKELSSRLGVTQATLSGWETGRFEISLHGLIACSNIFGVSVDSVLGLAEDHSNTAENINNSVVLQGNTGNNTISNGATAADANPNSELEDEVLRVFRQLDMRAKNKALTFLYNLEESERS